MNNFTLKMLLIQTYVHYLNASDQSNHTVQGDDKHKHV